jgi:uncharacterized C2H2 Zn-finger protein
MEIRCPNCKNIFEANSQQEVLLSNAIKNNQRLLIIECSECYKDVPIDPCNLLSEEPQKDEDKKNGIVEEISCPVCSAGIVSYIDEEKFWGCGECGSVWMNRNELDNALHQSN